MRIAALEALRSLADESHTAAIVERIKQARDEIERRKAEFVLLAVCSRAREACAGDVAAGLAEADGESRASLLRALARAGGPAALEATIGQLTDKDQAVRDEAVRMLSIWPDAGALPHLLQLAKEGESERHKVLAIRGLVRLATAVEGQPADVATLATAMNLATRAEEKRLVLGALGGVAGNEALAVVTPALDDPALAEEAALAAVLIAEKWDTPDKQPVRAAMSKVLQCAKNTQIRERAKKQGGT